MKPQQMIQSMRGVRSCLSVCASQVHHLQVALEQHGYYCGEDETVWWQFGSDTYSSLLTFQVWQLLFALLTTPIKPPL